MKARVSVDLPREIVEEAIRNHFGLDPKAEISVTVVPRISPREDRTIYRAHWTEERSV